MNYIRHLTGFYDRIQHDDRLNPTHISLYLALFQFWNLNHFQNPISISRNQMMSLSKISALGTYHKFIKQLQDFGYIEYLPSFNPYKGSLVNLHNFENSDVQNLNKKRIKKQTSAEQAVNRHHIKIDTGIEQALIPSVNSINILNSKHSVSTQKKFDENNLVIQNGAKRSEESQKEKLREKKFIKPTLPEIKMYFEEKDFLPEEAEKFFNHYESNGWLVGGKSKMKNWQAAARNWMINSRKFNSQSNVTLSPPKSLKPGHLTATTNKSYQDKL